MFSAGSVRRSKIAIVSTCLLIFVLAGTAFAQDTLRFNIDWVESGLFPTVEVYLSVSDAQGFPLNGLTKEDFTLEVDGQSLEEFEITPIHNTQQPLAFVLAVDTSGSMEADVDSTTALAKATQAAKTFIEKLSPDDRVSIVSFADEVTVQQALTKDKSAVKAALESLEPVGHTKLFDAAYQSIEILEEVPERKVIIILTDGKDSGVSEHTLEEVIQKVVVGGVPVYPIGFGNVDEQSLSGMAEAGGGYAQVKPDAAALESGFNTILNLLRNQYLLRFESNLPADNTQHEIKVNFTHQGQTFTSTAEFSTQPYAIDIVSPNDGSEFSDPVQISASVTPEGRTKVVNFYLDGEFIDDANNPPFQGQLPVEKEAYGEHVLKVVAEDINGITAEDQIEVTTRPPILIEFTSQQEGDALRGAPTIAVDVDALYELTSVSILADGNELGTFTEPPYEAQWPLYDVDPGEAVLAAIAEDIEGNTAREEILVDVNRSAGATGESGMESEPDETDDVDDGTSNDGGTLKVPGTGINIWIIVGVFLVLAGVLIPLAFRSRKKREVESPSSGEAVLHEIKGRSPDKAWPLGEKEIRLGRKTSDNDIPLDGLNASRRMAVIRPTEGGYVIYNLVPENPVLVNGSPVDQQHMLQPGDVLTMGDSEFHYQLKTS